MKKERKTTYALLVGERDKEKGRNCFENGVYAVFSVATIIAICQFAAIARPLPKAFRASVHHRVHKAHLAASLRPS